MKKKKLSVSEFIIVSMLLLLAISTICYYIYTPKTFVADFSSAWICVTISLLYSIGIGLFWAIMLIIFITLVAHTSLFKSKLESFHKRFKLICLISITTIVLLLSVFREGVFSYRYYSGNNDTIKNDFSFATALMKDSINKETIDIPVNYYNIERSRIVSGNKPSIRSTYYLILNGGEYTIPLSSADRNLVTAYFFEAGENTVSIYKNSSFLFAINGKNEPVSEEDAKALQSETTQSLTQITASADKQMAVMTEETEKWINESGEDVTWRFVFNGDKTVAEINAVNNPDVSLLWKFDGDYELYLIARINGEFKRISNTVNYKITNGELEIVE